MRMDGKRRGMKGKLTGEMKGSGGSSIFGCREGRREGALME